MSQNTTVPENAIGRFYPKWKANPPCPKRRSRLMLVMPGGHAGFTGFIALAKDGVHGVEAGVMPSRRRDQMRLKLHFGVIGQFDLFQWPENAAFINCVNRLHRMLLPRS